ncbi:MAG: mechanosensitive ion channel family protein [Salibacteraceae bacterium]
MDNLDDTLVKIKEMIILYGIELLTALVVLVIGLMVIGFITNNIMKLMEKRNVDASLRPFLRTLISVILKIALVITVLGMLEVETTSFVAILGAAGLAIGMALSGTLQNFAGGVMILIFKPFKVGDVIDAQGYIGAVNEIQIFNTILKTPDNRTIIIPNGGLATGSMVNLSTEPQRRVDWTVGIGYGDDVDKAEAVIQKLIDADSRILKDPAPFIAVSELADSSVNFTVRAWVNSADYWGVFFDMNKAVYKTFDQEGLNIPFPQMDVHVHQNN